MDLVTAKGGIAACQKRFDKGQIVEAIIGRRIPSNIPIQGVSVVFRASLNSKAVESLPLGIMRQAEYEKLMDWHADKWKALMKDKKFRRWARQNPLPVGTE